jgi:hypothetical protein
MSQTRSLILNRSSMLPETMTDGTADVNPDKNRPTKAPATDGVTPTMIHDIQYTRDADMYTDLRPNASE